MALRVGATTALVVLLAIIGTAVLFDRQQLGEIRGRTETAARTADDVVDAPPGTWLVKLTESGHEVTRSMPADLAAAALGVGPDVTGQTSLTADGRSWPAWADQRDGVTYVAVYDIRLHTGEEQRLLVSTIAAGVVGVLLAALTGLLAGRRAVRPLGEAMELQRQFVADASHELRTPLAVISTRAQLLRRHVAADAVGGGDGTVAARRLAEVDQLVHDTQAMADVVSDLLLSAQLEHVDEVAERVDLGALASEVVTSLRPYAAERGVTLVDESAGAAGGGGSCVVDGVGPSLRRSVLALVDNAISHSDKGSQVEVRSSMAGGEVRVDVVDHGHGVDVEDVERLSRRFSRGDGASGGRRVGLGLALVTQIVRSHGGRLGVAETPGGGATFTLLLPAAVER
ncbi:two-component sensor histidine kinase [Terrabacter tumescens]|uniref:Sensor-like histidine kinase SenX3 n=1 Tax=Terrabacter tumescens TaxID=60443 RepID=A0ABQ2IIW3_9MICO|nr:HAMP domain-containing sensor histidine kinase [Terrabacter tumescens]GGN09755.1 two-component sensor histidine kinase [Terrabacter tumescens]